MEKIFALIYGLTVANIVVADESYIDFIRNEYTDIVEITDLETKPSIGWAYVDGQFIPVNQTIIEPTVEPAE